MKKTKIEFPKEGLRPADVECIEKSQYGAHALISAVLQHLQFQSLLTPGNAPNGPASITAGFYLALLEFTCDTWPPCVKAGGGTTEEGMKIAREYLKDVLTMLMETNLTQVANKEGETAPNVVKFPGKAVR